MLGIQISLCNRHMFSESMDQKINIMDWNCQKPTITTIIQFHSLWIIWWCFSDPMDIYKRCQVITADFVYSWKFLEPIEVFSLGVHQINSFGNWRQKLSSILLFDNITFLFGGTPVGITKRYRKVFARRKKHLREHFFMITACCRTHQMAMKNSGAFVFLRLCSFSTKEWSLSKRWKNFRYVRSKFSMLTFFIAS